MSIKWYGGNTSIMNIIFLTLVRITNIEDRGIYTDLMREFRNEGHNIYIVSPHERKYKLETSLQNKDNVNYLNVKTLNIQKTNIIEKGLATLLIEKQFKRAIQKHLNNVSFDVILYSTPPITLIDVIKYLKKRNPKAISYLLLKDIFPQNAVDLHIFSRKSIFYKFFRKKEIQLYKLSDYIGCMSPANVEYITKHNSFLNPQIIEIAPNSIELSEKEKEIDRLTIRKKYNLPIKTPILIYGGNIGKPQGIDYLISCLEVCKKEENLHIVIVGNGTDYEKLYHWYKKNNPNNTSIFKSLPKEDYDRLVRACDVGLIFLDHHFTIPNFPSRLLSYLEAELPILAATDINSDIGKIAEENHFGYWCESVKPSDFLEIIKKLFKSDMKLMGENGFTFLRNNYMTSHTYSAIMKHIINQ